MVPAVNNSLVPLASKIGPELEPSLPNAWNITLAVVAEFSDLPVVSDIFQSPSETKEY